MSAKTPRARIFARHILAAAPCRGLPSSSAGGGFTEAPAAAVGNTEIRFEPGTRVVIDTPNLPTSDAGIDAQWYTTVTSRSSAAGVTTEIAELKCYIDLNGAVQASSTTATDVIIGQTGVAAGVGTITTAVFGTILGGTMECLELPAGGELDINVAVEREGGGLAGIIDLTIGVTNIVDSGGDWAAGAVKVIAPGSIAAGDTIYLTCGEAADGNAAGDYEAGKFLLTFICQYAVPS